MLFVSSYIKKNLCYEYIFPSITYSVFTLAPTSGDITKQAKKFHYSPLDSVTIEAAPVLLRRSADTSRKHSMNDEGARSFMSRYEERYVAVRIQVNELVIM